jgi:hypothetical protein
MPPGAVGKRLTGGSFDDPVGAHEERRGDFDAECLRCPQIDNQLGIACLLYSQVPRTCSLEDAIYVTRGAYESLAGARGVYQQSSGVDVTFLAVDRRQPALRDYLHYVRGVRLKHARRRNVERADFRRRKLGDDTVDIFSFLRFTENRIQPKRAGCGLCLSTVNRICRIRSEYYAYARKPRHQRLEELNALLV